MRKLFSFLSLVSLLAVNNYEAKAQTVFFDGFDISSFTTGTSDGTPAATYTFSTPGNIGTIGTTFVSGSNYMATISSGVSGTAANNKAYFYAPLNVYSSPFNLTLSSNNPGVITWTFNMRTSNAVTSSSPTQNVISGGVDLCGNAAGNIYNGSPTGYGVVFNSGAAGGVNLVRFSAGMATNTTLITETTTIPKTDYYSVRVTYNSATNQWSLFVRDDGAAAFSDPSTGVTTQQGATITDATYTGQAMVNFGVIYCWTSGAGKHMYVDNYQVTDVLPPCSGTPTAGSVQSNVYSGCGLSYNANLSLTGATIATGLTYQWYNSADDATWSAVSGATNATYTASVTANVYYQCQLTCTNSSLSATTAGQFLAIDIPATATLPFYESFESSWINGCGTADQPDNYWVNTFATGNRSWRRSDDFTTAGWSGGSLGIYSPAASDGYYSADFSSYSVASGNTGALNLYINMPVGTKQINYDYINEDGTDFIVCQISTDGGVTFTTIDAPPDDATSWTTRTFTTTLAANPAIIRFLATSDFGVSNIGLDNIHICMAPAPITGSNQVCAGAAITLTDAGGGTWSTSDPTTAIVGSSSGVVTGVAAGYPNITYNQSGCTSVISLTVNPSPAPFTGSTNICLGMADTLIPAVSGGVWAINNTSLATIDPALGIITGVVTGIDTVSYTLPTGCFLTTSVTMNISPAGITGSPNACMGLTSLLNDITPSGTWTSSNTSVATIDITGLVTGIVNGATTIAYTLADGCAAILPVTVNTTPPPITGNMPLCVGDTASLSDEYGGGSGSYYTSNPGIVTANSVSGTITAISSGTAIISYMMPTGCMAQVTATVNTSPSFTSTPNNICVFSNSTFTAIPSGGSWSSGNTFLATVDPVMGIVSGINPGNPNISYTLADGCFSTTTTNILSAPDEISGVPKVCLGSTQLLGDITPGGTWLSSSAVLAPIGNTTGLVTGLAPGIAVITYKLSSTGCYSVMNMSVNTLPTTLSITGGGNYCIGDTGVHIMLNSVSQPAVNYQLFNGALPVATYAGNGGVIDIGPVTAVGTYTVQAVNPSTGCFVNLSAGVSVGISPLPTIYGLQAPSTSYCSGGSGIDVMLDSSDNGILYQLFLNGTYTGTQYLGSTYMSIDFLPQTTPGIYTVLAFNPSTGCTSIMAGSPSVTINPLPQAYDVSGGGGFCPYAPGVHVGLDFSVPGINYQLNFNGVPVGVPVLGSSSSIDFGLQSDTGSYTVTATNAITGCVSDMSGIAVVTNYPVPASYLVAGGGSYCAGGTGVTVLLNSSDYGINYQLYNGTMAIGAPIPGDGGFAPLSFGLQTLPGTYTITGTDITNGCTSNMTDATTVTINPLPALYPLTGGGAYCVGDTGLHVGLFNTDSGIQYQLFLNGIATGAGPFTGAGTVLDFGLETMPGFYTVSSSNPITGCASNMPGSVSISINPLPVLRNVTGGGSYCAGGAGVHVSLDYSDVGISYQLFDGTTMVGVPEPGAGSGIDFGLQTVAGAYNVMATNSVTGCNVSMSGSATVSINPQPLVFTVTGASSSYCVGDSGIHINLTGSETGISYQLYDGSVISGGLVAGTGAPVDFGLQTAAGAYTIAAENLVSGCSANMIGSPVIRINPLPASYNVTGGGDFCAGGLGVHVGLNNSDTGVYYQLYQGVMPIGSPMAGNGSAIDFGLISGAGSYSAIATNTRTTCPANMAGTASVIVNPLPVAYNITGGGSYCSGEAGVPVGLDNSGSGITYQLFLGSVATGIPYSGSAGSPINFGIQTAPGTYTIKATDFVTGCNAIMSGSKTVIENALPPVYTMYGGGAYCAGGTGVHVNLSGSTTGINYQLYNMGSPVGGLITATGAAIDFGAHTISGTYTAVAINSLTGCSSPMMGVSTITVNPLPDAYSITGGGNYCTGGTGVLTGLNHSDIGINYQLYNGAIATGSPVSGDGLPISFGLQSTPGTYSVKATNTLTTCHNTMTGTASIAISPMVSPAVSVSTLTGSSVCGGNVITFSPVPTNGGATPTYSWLVNGSFVSAANSYSYAPANGDVVKVTMVSDASCLNYTNATGQMVMDVNPYETPSAAVTATPGNRVCEGSQATFTATPAFEGTTPVYTWIRNSVFVGSGLTFSCVPANGDVIVFMMGSSYPCRTVDTVYTTELMAVDLPLSPIVTISANPGTNIAPGELVTLRAAVSDGGASPAYQWFLNGTAIPGAERATLTENNFVNGDSVSCVVTGDNACGTGISYNSVIFNVAAEGVNSLTLKGDISIIPNPNNGVFTITGSLGSAAGNDITFEITDVLGQVVYSGKLNPTNGTINQKVSLGSGFANGMYLLNLHTGNDNKVFHLVIEQ